MVEKTGDLGKLDGFDSRIRSSGMLFGEGLATGVVEIRQSEIGIDEVTESRMVVAMVHVGQAGGSVIGVAGEAEADPGPRGRYSTQGPGA